MPLTGSSTNASEPKPIYEDDPMTADPSGEILDATLVE